MAQTRRSQLNDTLLVEIARKVACAFEESILRGLRRSMGSSSGCADRGFLQDQYEPIDVDSLIDEVLEVARQKSCAKKCCIESPTNTDVDSPAMLCVICGGPTTVGGVHKGW